MRLDVPHNSEPECSGAKVINLNQVGTLVVSVSKFALHFMYKLHRDAIQKTVSKLGHQEDSSSELCGLFDLLFVNDHRFGS